MRILIMEGDEPMAEAIRDMLRHDYCCEICGDGENGLGLLREGGYEGAILDEDLKNSDGLEILRKARSLGCGLPVLFLTNHWGQVARQRACCLENGADYCLTKPFDMQELQAAMKAILRRRGEMMPESLRFGNLILDPSDYTLRGPEAFLHLGKKEFDVLHLLMLNRGIVVSKETILLKVWGNDRDAVENNVETYVSLLRKKMEYLKANVGIRTIRRVGYQMAEKACFAEAPGIFCS